MREDQRKLVELVLYYATLGALLYFGVKYLLGWLLPLVCGVGIAALLRPATLRLTRRGLPERASALLVLGGFYLCAAALVGLFCTILLAQLYELLLKTPELFSTTLAPLFSEGESWLSATIGRFFPQSSEQVQAFSAAVRDAVRSAAVSGSTHLVGWLAGLAARLPILLLTGAFTIMISAFTAVGYRGFGAFFRAGMPIRMQKFMQSARRFLRETVWEFVRAYTMLLAITFSELALGLWLLGFEYVMPIAAAIALVDLLPIVGSGIVLVPWGIVQLVMGDAWGGIGLILLFAAMAVARSILEPRIVSRQLGLHPVATITAMYAGLRIAGPLGLFVAPVLLLAADRLLWRPAEEQL